MNLSGSVKLVSQLLDLPIVDKNERWCGIVDDVEFYGVPGKEMRVKALLIGPGAYEGRMPAWLFWLVRMVAGDRMARVPADEIVEIGSVVKLKSTAEELKLHAVEDKAREWIPRVGAL
jgi:sporulation protein YlmC with PRC-barrel domain